MLWSATACLPLLVSDGTNDYGLSSTPIEQVDISTGQPSYLLADHLGSVRVVTDQTGAVITTLLPATLSAHAPATLLEKLSLMFVQPEA